MRRTLLAAALFALAAAAVSGNSGCSGEPPRTRLHGTVKLQGQPVTSGSVIFIARDNMTYLADIQPDGTYSVDRVPLGPVAVSVQQAPPRPASRPATGPKAGGMESKDQKREAEPPEPKAKGPAVPPRYADAKLAILGFEVTKQPDQEWSVDLTP